MKTNKDYIGFKAWGLGFDAHLTMVYTGPLVEEQVIEIREILLRSVPSTFYSLAKRDEITMFGENNEIPVVLVDPHDEVRSLREVLTENPLIPNPSQWMWNPHITLKFIENQPLVIPSLIKLSHLDVY